MIHDRGCFPPVLTRTKRPSLPPPIPAPSFHCGGAGREGGGEIDCSTFPISLLFFLSKGTLYGRQ